MSKLYNAMALRLTFVLSGAQLPSLKREEGQTLAEYAMILGLVAILVVAALTFFQARITNLFSNIATNL
jgi:pilus assembly protein Flp/PilA